MATKDRRVEMVLSRDMAPTQSLLIKKRAVLLRRISKDIDSLIPLIWALGKTTTIAAEELSYMERGCRDAKVLLNRCR